MKKSILAISLMTVAMAVFAIDYPTYKPTTPTYGGGGSTSNGGDDNTTYGGYSTTTSGGVTTYGEGAAVGPRRTNWGGGTPVDPKEGDTKIEIIDGEQVVFQYIGGRWVATDLKPGDYGASDQSPIGSTMVLLFFAAAAAGVIALRRRKAMAIVALLLMANGAWAASTVVYVYYPNATDARIQFNVAGGSWKDYEATPSIGIWTNPCSGWWRYETEETISNGLQMQLKKTDNSWTNWLQPNTGLTVGEHFYKIEPWSTNEVDRSQCPCIGGVTKHNLTLSGANGSFKVDGSAYDSANKQYTEGSHIVVAIPDEGYEFVEWSDGVNTATHPEINLTEDRTLTATFRLRETPAPTPQDGDPKVGNCDGCYLVTE